jgi:hypothetical protein
VVFFSAGGVRVARHFTQSSEQPFQSYPKDALETHLSGVPPALERATKECCDMSFEAAKATAEKHLVEGATLDEVKIAAQDLRALSPDSALAELVEEKIRRILSGCADHGAEDGA